LRAAVHQGKDKFLTLTGQAWNSAVPEPAQDDAFELKLPQGFVQMLAAAASIVNRNEFRRILRGINLSSCGITATDGRQRRLQEPQHGRVRHVGGTRNRQS